MADPSWQPHARMVANRGDIAAKSLEGKVIAKRFVEGALYEVAVPQAPVRGEPRLDALLDTEALKGERVMVYDSNENGWSWGQLVDDDYVGWLPSDALRPAGAPPRRCGSAARRRDAGSRSAANRRSRRRLAGPTTSHSRCCRRP